MSNKKVIKEMFDDKFNKNANYEQILSEVEGVRKTKNVTFRYSLLPICTVLVICGVILVNLSNNDIDDSIRESEYVEMEQAMLDVGFDVGITMQMEGIVDNEDVARAGSFLRIEMPDFFGGIFNEAGNTVIYLVNDNQENRTSIANHFSISENTVTFRQATHSFNYLIELQDIISEKMLEGRFDFVIAFGVKEAENVLEVMVSESVQERQIAELKNLDETGTAIRVVRGGPAVLDFLHY